MKQRILCLLITIFLFAGQTAFTAAAAPAYEATQETVIAKDLIHKHMVRLTEKGWQNINIVTADLNEPTLQMKLLRSPDGVSRLETMMTHAQNGEVDAAINADFFAWRSGLSGHGSSIGLMVEQGELITSSDTTDNMASFGQDTFGNLLIDYIRTSITVTAPNGDTAAIKHLNKYDSLDGIVMYTGDFQKTSFGSKDNITELVVENDKVVEIRQDMEPVLIPENGYVLTFLPEFNNFISEHFAVGDAIRTEITLTPDRALETAVGGGTMLVTGGIAAKNTHNISGNNPRTAVGIDRTGKILTMVTVDGRSQNSVGMTLAELRDLMMELGAYDAINFDGGGSTRMIVRDSKDGALKTVNQPTENRAVINGIGVKSAAQATNVLGRLILEPEQTVFKDTAIEIPMRAEDTNYKPMDIDASEVQLSASGVIGEWQGEAFYPRSAGTLQVKATLDNIQGACEIEVLEKPVKLLIECYTDSPVKGEAMNIWVKGIDQNGRVAMIPNRFITFESDKVRQEGDRVIPLQDGSFEIKISYQGLEADTGAKESQQFPYLETDEVYNRSFDATQGFHLNIFGERQTGNKMIHRILENRVAANIGNGSDTSIIMTSTDYLKGKVSADSTENYQKTVEENVTIITLNNLNGSIVSSDYSQFEKLVSDLKNIRTDYLILAMNKGLDAFTSAPEKEAVETLIKEYIVKQGKMVFVVSGGERDSVKVQDGIRHLTVGAIEGDTLLELVDRMLNGSYLRFHIKNHTLSYEFVKYE